MHENLVQWVFLREKNYLRECLGFDWNRVIGSNFSTPYGIIDFALECPDSTIHIIELETGITSISKLDYCVDQTRRYMRLSEDWKSPVKATVLYADDLTSLKFELKLQEASKEFGFGLSVYKQSRISQLYVECIKLLEKTSGLDIGKPIAMDVCFLYWMNRIIALFDDSDSIEKSDALLKFGKSNETGFNVRCRYCHDFELIYEESKENDKYLSLTKSGIRFREALNPLIHTRKGEMPLSHEQESILIESLINGNIYKCKANIFHFLRYVHLTSGQLIPRSKAKVPSEYVKVWNTHLGTSYNSYTLTKFLNFTCNHCIELGCVERIESPRNEPVYSVVLTSLGSRILGFFELFLHLKREQITLPIMI